MMTICFGDDDAGIDVMPIKNQGQLRIFNVFMLDFSAIINKMVS